MPLPFYIFIFTLIFAPLAFGTVEYWSLGTVEFLIPAALILLCAIQFTKKNPPVRIPGLLPLVLLLSWMAIQLVPLPPRIVQIIAPQIYDIYQPLLALSEQHSWIPLTVQTKATLQELLRFNAYGLFYILTIQLLSRRDYLRKTVTIVAWFAAVIALEAIAQKLTSPHAIYWFRTSAQAGFPVGPWVYSNHFAGFMAMLFPITLALFLYYRPRYDAGEPLRAKFLALFTSPGTNKHLLFGFAAFLTGVSILLSASRGGIITLALTFSLFIIFSGNLTGQRRNTWAILLVTLMLLMISRLGSEQIMLKFADILGTHGINTSERLPVLMDSIKMFRAFWITGSGFGTYEFTFPAYRSVPDETIIFDHAHNDYIELMSTGGLIGFLLAAWFVVSVITHALQMLRKRREYYNQLLTIAALTAVIALLLHSLIDFQMYNGANGLYFFFFCALAVTAANTRLHYEHSPTLLPAAPRRQAAMTFILTVIVLSAGVWYNVAAFRARRTFAPVRSIYLNKNIPAQRLKDIYHCSETADRLDPFESRYLSAMAAVSSFLGTPGQACKEYLQATLLNPLSARLIQQLALTLPPDQSQEADMLLALGCRYEPLFFNYYLTYADWLIASSRQTQAMSFIQKAIKKHPEWTHKLSNFIFLHTLTRADITSLLPPHPKAWHAAGNIMEKEGKIYEAEYYYRNALGYLDNHTAQPVYFSRLYRLYMGQKKYNDALTILRMAIEHLPDNARFHRQLGDYYRKQGITYRAIEEYRQALLLNPDNPGLKQQLDKLPGK
jgi:tetratricopeptide (TPR) repeat protein